VSPDDRQVFVSYCRADVAWVERLKVHFQPLVRRSALDLWDDSRVRPGESWRDEIAKALARARVAILLVSADFLASEFVANNELPPILHRAARDGLLVVPLIVSPCLYTEHEELSRYQSSNRPDKPLSGMSRTEAEAALVALCRGVDQYFRRLATDGPLGDRAGPADRARPGGSAPAAAYRSMVVERPLNLGFDGSAPDGIPIGWFNSFGYVSGVSTEYAIRVTRRSEDRGDGACVVLEKAAPASGEFGSLMQRCPARFLAGKTLRLEGELRAEHVDGWGGLWLRADAEDASNVFFDNMSRRPVTGTTAWARHFIDAPMPGAMEWLNYGIVLAGSGTLFADNIRLLVWTPDGRWTDV